MSMGTKWDIPGNSKISAKVAELLMEASSDGDLSLGRFGGLQSQGKWLAGSRGDADQ